MYVPIYMVKRGVYPCTTMYHPTYHVSLHMAYMTYTIHAIYHNTQISHITQVVIRAYHVRYHTIRDVQYHTSHMHTPPMYHISHMSYTTYVHVTIYLIYHIPHIAYTAIPPHTTLYHPRGGVITTD